ncbi:MAG: GNAT family N-acetyltransferase [Inquilinus sp.]|nr:GNAT family N-acetyltransferase [Inquilinus sp.]
MPADPPKPRGKPRSPRRKPVAKLRITVTHLEMTHPPAHRPVPMPGGALALLHAERPTTSFYRYLYNTVGEPWLWGDRRAFDDDAIRAILDDPRTTVLVLYRNGVPAGFAELHRRDERTTELVYLGLVPEFMDQGLGRYLLQAAVEHGWGHDGIERMIVQTCDLDHPKAVVLYQWIGFVPTGQEQLVRDDPRALGLIPATAAPHRPMAKGRPPSAGPG